MKTPVSVSPFEAFYIADEILRGRPSMLEPQDLPGRYGRVVRAIDHLLSVIGASAVVAGGWAVWRHGYEGRITQDIDVALPASQVDEFLRVASVAGFDLLPLQLGRWPKMTHKESGVKVDILPEGARPGTALKMAPTTIPHPSAMGAARGILKYITLPSLIELKLAAGRTRDQSDVMALVLANSGQVEQIRKHLENVHTDYVAAFDQLIQRAKLEGLDP
jgi:hypothetical protein